MRRKGLLIYTLICLVSFVAYFPSLIALEKLMLADRISSGLTRLIRNECKTEVQIDSVKIVYGLFASRWEAYRKGERLFVGSLKRGIAIFNVPDTLENQCPARTYWWESKRHAFVEKEQPYGGETDDWSTYTFPGFFSLVALGVSGWIIIWIRSRPRTPV